MVLPDYLYFWCRGRNPVRSQMLHFSLMQCDFLKRQSTIYIFIFLLQGIQTAICQPGQRLIEQYVHESLVTEAGIMHMDHNQSAHF